MTTSIKDIETTIGFVGRLFFGSDPAGTIRDMLETAVDDDPEAGTAKPRCTIPGPPGLGGCVLAPHARDVSCCYDVAGEGEAR